MCTVTKPIIRFTPNFVNGGHLSPSLRGSSFIPFYLAVSEILPCLQIYDTPFTFSPVQDGCVQLRMDGDLQANETSTDKMS